ncbi:MAG: hypothetical protein ABSH34_31055 [Verrucomicrobiota bacterium]
MMNPLEPPDTLHLRAAKGWIGRGDHAAADSEPEQISHASHAHPDVLQGLWRIYADPQH